MTEVLTRGERNNDPGNMNFIPLARAFNGELRVETLPNGHPGRFGVYDTMLHGARAAAEEVLIKVLKQGLINLDSLIGDPKIGWAPASDGNIPIAYVKTVLGYASAAFRVTVGGTLTGLTDLRVAVKNVVFLQALTGGIFTVENGRYPVNLTPDDHLAACHSALAAQGLE